MERQLVSESWISMQVNEVKFYVWRDESIIGEHNSGFLSGDICRKVCLRKLAPFIAPD